MRSYTVLVSLDGGTTWAKHAKPVKASSGQAAAEAVRKESPELRQDESALFFTTTKFEPIAKRKQLIEAWRWGKAEGKPPAQGELS